MSSSQKNDKNKKEKEEVMEIKGYFGKKGMDRIIQDVNKYNSKKEIDLRKTSEYYEEDGFYTYLCFYPDSGVTEVDPFTKSEMLYLQEHGFVFKNEGKEIVDVKTLKE